MKKNNTGKSIRSDRSSEGLPYDRSRVRLIDVTYVGRQFSMEHRHVLHQHADRLELLYIFSGTGRYQVGRREYAVTEGDMVICNAGTLHGEYFTLPNDIQTYCCGYAGVQIDGLPENALISHEKRPVVSLRTYRDAIRQAMGRIYRLHRSRFPDAYLAPVMADLVLAMTYFELSEQEKSMDRTPILQKNETLMRDITEYLDNNYRNENLRMRDLVRQFHVSESFLSHAFAKETGLSPKRYIVLRRIGEAQSLLENTDLPIGEIVTELGFSSSVHFSSTFKKYVGMSPREYRNYYRK